jgi:hypothetical protein
MAIPHWLTECIQARVDDQHSIDPTQNVLEFPQRKADGSRNDGQSALDLVYRAAEVVGELEVHARQIETRAEAFGRDALEKLRLAKRRAEAAESALYLAESRISSAEAKLHEAQLRAKKAEARARELDQALMLVEDAIRTRLLRMQPDAQAHRAA